MSKRKTIVSLKNHEQPAISYLLDILSDSRAVTLGVVKGISKKELNWQPYEGWNSISALLIHIYSVNEALRIKYLEGRKLKKSEEAEHGPHVALGEHLPDIISNRPLKYYLKKLKRSRATLIDGISKLDKKAFYKKKKGYDPVSGCNLGWVLYHLIEDELNHKGQILLIRKLYKERKKKKK